MMITIPELVPMMITIPELDKINDFYIEHIFCYKKADSKNPNSDFNIKLRTTGLGLSIVVKCKCCGTKKDVTDYSVW